MPKPNRDCWLWAPLVLALTLPLAACTEDGDPIDMLEPVDPDTATVVAIDRFSEAAATLMVRDAANGLPGPNEPVDFDQAPFITRGLSPQGEVVEYYNFDVQPTEAAPIFVLFREGEDAPVADQLNIVDVIPGDPGYNDFWHVHAVTVPADYVANTIVDVATLMDEGYAIERTDLIVNCPVVPDGSTATLRHGGGSAELVRGWYRGEVVTYFEFGEAQLHVPPPADGHPEVPVSPIYVTFNLDPDPADPASGPPSGFVTEADGVQTHNVVATVPADAGYSPLWLVSVYGNADFDAVSDLSSAQAAARLADGVATVNCPIVVAP